MPLSCDVKTITDYLENVSDREFWHLQKIDSKKTKPNPVGTATADLEALLDWIVRSNDDKSNIYEQVNTPRKGQAKKATRDEVKWLTRYHVDVDMPPEMVARGDEDEIAEWLQATEEAINTLVKRKRPHLIMTGNGLQAHWPFAKPIKATPETKARVEGVNARIAHKLKADRCHNCDRILRVPGTVNWPSEKKRRDGYKPVMAELWHVSEAVFSADDFKHLPAAPMKMTIVGGEHRRNWLLGDYSDSYEPVTMDELLREDPIIHKQALERLEETADRSSAVYCWMKDCIRAMCHILECEAQDLLDDDDAAKNICELMFEGDAEWLDHYDDKGLAKMGWDLRTCLYHACDEQTNTPGTRAQAETVRLKAHSLTVTHDKLTMLQHRRLFIDHVRETLEKDDLPNVVKTAGHVPSARQSATESNIREIFDRAGITARWNVMRDEAVYGVRERVGRRQAGDSDEEAERRATAPRFHFERALGGTSPDSLSRAQESLVADALHELGIVARREIGSLLDIVAKEDRFHPIEEYCTQKPWDGVDRIGQLAKALESTHPLKRRYLDIFFRQAVAAVKSLDRYMEGDSGEMIGSVVILVGPQDIGKTSFWNDLIPPGMKSKGEMLKLGGMKEADNKRDLLSGLVAICDEIGAGLDYSQAEEIKNFITAREDAFRVAYAHAVTNKPRMTQFVGTSNELHLRDHTGSRRWLAMDVNFIDWDLMNELMDDAGFLQQCYAQAWTAVMDEGKVWWLTGKESDTRATFNQRYESIVPEIGEVEGYMNRAGSAQHRPEWLTMPQIFKALGMRHTAVKARHVHRHIVDVEGIAFRNEHHKDGRIYYNVYAFPVTVDMLHRLEGR